MPRDYSRLIDFMDSSFEIMTWQGDSEQMTPSEAVEALQNTLLPPENVISFVEVNYNIVLGDSPYQLYPDAKDFIFTQGWGTTGEDEAILIFKEQDSGDLYWSGILYANGHFAAQSTVETDIGWQAPSTESCQDIQTLLETTFGLTDARLNDEGYECIIRLMGSAVDFPETKEAVFAQLQAALEQEGWGIEPQYEASGPNYQNGGFRHDDKSLVMLAYIGWVPSESGICPTSQPINNCDLSPEQKLFAITLRVAELVD